jgi:hypothetical protein
MTGARRQRNGLLVPWIVDWDRGQAEQQRLSEELGLDLDLSPNQLHALGVATSEARGEGHAPAQDLTLSEEASNILDRIVAKRACMPFTSRCTCGQHEPHEIGDGQALGLGSPEGAYMAPEISGMGISTPNGQGQGVHAGGDVGGNREEIETIE